MTRTYFGRPLGRVNADILRTLRQLKRAEGPARTSLYKDLAEHTVALREHYIVDKTGEPDWTGQVSAYRHHVHDLYAQAGYDRAAAKTIQSSIRFHVGNVIRDLLPEDELEFLGLHKASPLEKSRTTRRDDYVLLQRAKKLLTTHPELMEEAR